MRKKLVVDPSCQEFVDDYLERWSACKGCVLHRKTRTRPIMRGEIPFEVLLVGEAPGESEDTLGWPFVGPAGKLLDTILSRALGSSSYLIVNTVVCTPPRTNNRKIREPEQGEKEVCLPHIMELVDEFDPKLVVSVGKHADGILPMDHHHMLHPAAVFKYPQRKADIAVNKCVFSLQEALTAKEKANVDLVSENE